MFWTKKEPIVEQIHSKTYDMLMEINVEVSKLKAEVERIDNNYVRLKGFMNKKLYGLKEEPQDEQEIKPVDEKINDGFDFVRNVV